MKQRFPVISALVLAFVLNGCASAPVRLATPSGLPEIAISGVTKKQIVDFVVGDKLAAGFEIRSVDDYSLVIARDIDDFSARALYGSDFDRTPEARITYNLVDNNDGVKIFVRSEMVTNPQSRFESVRDFTQTWGGDAQAELERIKIIMENSTTPGN